MTCVFFGHKETRASIKSLLEVEIKKLIEQRNYNEFLVGNHGAFDSIVYSVLQDLRNVYPSI